MLSEDKINGQLLMFLVVTLMVVALVGVYPFRLKAVLGKPSQEARMLGRWEASLLTS